MVNVAFWYLYQLQIWFDLISVGEPVNIFNTLVSHEGTDPSLCPLLGGDYLIPARSRFLMSDISRMDPLVNGKVQSRVRSRFNSLDSGRCGCNFKIVIFPCTLRNEFWSIFREIASRYMSQNPIDDKSTLVQMMAWCLQAPSHYLSQCWPRSLLTHSVIRPQWIKPLCAELLSANIKIYFCTQSFLRIENWSFLMRNKDLFILHCNGCWCHSDTRSQGINSHCIVYEFYHEIDLYTVLLYNFVRFEKIFSLNLEEMIKKLV